jgi:hypothetical protein
MNDKRTDQTQAAVWRVVDERELNRILWRGEGWRIIQPVTWAVPQEPRHE